MTEDPPVLRVTDLTVRLAGHLIVDRISFAVQPGETAAIIGPNGAGKSVLVKAILRLLPKTSGQVEIFGVDHAKYRKIARQVSYIPQRLDLEADFPLTVGGLFALKSARFIGMTAADRTRMMRLLELVGMQDFVTARLSELSGGQLQRVLIAYSLMDNPQLLILDEPSAGIDVQGQEAMYALLKRIQKQQHLTLILISHELDVIMEYADQVLCINQRLLCAGHPHDVLTNDLLKQMYGTPMQHFHHGH